MKRISAILLACLLALSLLGCSDSVSQEEMLQLTTEVEELQNQVDHIGDLEDCIEDLEGRIDELEAQLSEPVSEEPETVPVEPAKPVKPDQPDKPDEPAKPAPGEFDEAAVLEQLIVTEHKFGNDWWNYSFLVIENLSPFNLSITANVKFYDTDGNLTGVSNASQEAVQSGFHTILLFMPDEPYETMEYELDISEEDRWDCVLSDLSYEATGATNKVILSVTNNGDDPASFVQAKVLFFNGTESVGYADNYLIDDDNELKPGKTLAREFECYEPFDSYQIFLTGRK